MAHRFRTALVLSLRYLFLTRFSWLLGLLLVLLVPLCRDLFPSLLANLLVLDHPAQVLHVSWLSFWCAATVLETLRVTTINAQFRFDDYRRSVDEFNRAWERGHVAEVEDWYRHPYGWITFAAGLITAVAIWWAIVRSCIVATAQDPAESWSAYVTQLTAAEVARACWAQAAWGLALALLVLILLHALVIGLGLLTHWRRQQSWGRDWEQRWGLLRARRALHRMLGPGYFREVSPEEDPEHVIKLRVAPGHLGMMLYTVAFGSWYALNYLAAIGADAMPTETSPYPALFYGLLSLLLVSYLLPGFSFFFDRYRVPVTLVLLGSTLLLYGFFGTDHYYELYPEPRRGELAEIADFASVIEDWQLPAGADGKRTLVVVDASGGGIQAAAWTAQVLTGLHEVYGDPFSRSIGLISAVSGGSVGSMFYLINRSELSGDVSQAAGQPALTPAAIAHIRQAARASALEATAWGVAYPDTMRVLFPAVVGETVDRGWSVERAWRQRMWSADPQPVDFSDLRLSELHTRIREHQLPVVVFNATVVETGQRLLLSPVLSPPSPQPSEHTAGAAELFREFPDAQLRVATAARLSATFPYVAPAARAAPMEDRASSPISVCHIVDGGYTDNEGAVTSVDWINRLLLHYGQEGRLQQCPFDRVLLIRIQAFPAGYASDQPRRTSSLAGWRAALLGPLEAMMQVRKASQTERGDLEIGLLTQATRASIAAARERYSSQFQAAQAVIDGLQTASVPPPPDLSPADRARLQLERQDQVRTVEMLRDAAQAKQLRLTDMQILAVTIDFHPPEDVRIPLSWKLTHRQKANLDAAWQKVVDGTHPHRPLAEIDAVFARRPEADYAARRP